MICCSGICFREHAFNLCFVQRQFGGWLVIDLIDDVALDDIGTESILCFCVCKL